MPMAPFPGFQIPARWHHGGRIVNRPVSGDGSDVIGDPCIVRDPTVGGYRMFLFCQPPGCGQSVCRSLTDVGPGNWSQPGPIAFTNSPAHGSHKPYIVTDAHQPNEAALINGRYCMVSVGLTATWDKFSHRAWADALAGPWTWDEQPLIERGGPGAFDEKHADAVSGFHFPERGEILYCYMGYPKQAQPRRGSPFGNGQGAAIGRIGERHVTKLGQTLPPCEKPGHWASGWVGGLQIIPGKNSRWVGLLNASPTAPDPANREVWTEEPPPSLGGFAFCDEELPIKNWRWAEQPIERFEEVPPAAVADGEAGNFWRHHILILPSGKVAMFYNCGHYGHESLYVKYGIDE